MTITKSNRRSEYRWLLGTCAVAASVSVACADGDGVSPIGTGCSDCNVILISIDTLRADHLSVYGYPRPTTPHLEEFAEDGIVFENAYHTGGGTLPSHLSILTSLYPITHGVTTKNAKPLHDDWTTLGETLSDAGYATAAFVDGGWMRAKFGFDQGFDVFEDEADGFTDNRPRAEEWLRQRGNERFFLFLHTFDVHSKLQRAYDCPGDYPVRYIRDLDIEFDGCKDGRCATELFKWVNAEVEAGRLNASEYFAPEEIDYFSSLYDGCIKYVDDQLHGFFQFLRELELYERSLIIITSDHGEEFLERGKFIHDHGGFEEIAHIPLLLKLPFSPVRDIRVPHLAATVDLMPTVLRLLGVPQPGQVQGVSLLPAIVGGRPTRNEIHIYGVLRTDRWKYFRHRKELYDLEVDPEERNNLYATHPEVVQSMEARLSARLDADHEMREAFLEGRLPATGVELTEEEREELEALGYLG